MMGVAFDDLAAVQRHSAPDGELDPRTLLLGRSRRPTRCAFCRSQSTAGLALLTRRFGIRGYATSVHTACASGGQAIGTALKLIRRGARRLRAGRRLRFDDQPGRARGLLPAVGASRPTTTTPQRASRPFDATRNGFVLGEGAGFLVLEEWEAARATRRAHLRGACRRRQFAVVVSHHRFAAGRRRPDPGDARSACATPAPRRTTSTTSTRTARRRG